MFLAAAVLQTIGTLLFLKIDPTATATSVLAATEQRHLREAGHYHSIDSRIAQEQEVEEDNTNNFAEAVWQRRRHYPVPIGARLCDVALFGRAFLERRHYT